ncbi:MAG: serine hydrolase [Saonia sp.]
MENSIEKGIYPNIHSVLILKNNELVYENYFDGKDELWGKELGVIAHHRDSLHDVRSISKSVVSACIGIAVMQGKIDGIDQSIFDFYPEYKQYDTGKRSELTIAHLLTMSSGIEWNEDVPYDDPENSEIQMTSSTDPIEFVLSRPLTNSPGKVWEYNGGTTQLLASIIEKTSGLNVHEFAKKYLFEPLDIKNSEWVFFPDTKLPAAASGLRLRSRDLLKIGMLYAQKGTWNGIRILSDDWVNRSTTSHIRFGRNNNVGYGYQFWILSADTIWENQSHTIAAAIGNGGQRIYLDTKHNLITVITAGNYNQWTIEKDSEALLRDFIYPSFL